MQDAIDLHSRSATRPATIRIEPSPAWPRINFAEIWLYRELLYFLVWRDVKVRYKQTALGATWAILQPVLTMVVFNLFFGKLAKMPSDGVPYPLFSLAALVPWTFFSNGLGQASNSLVASANLLKKVYFPRLIIPVASVTAQLVDFLLAFVVLLGMMAWFRWRLTPNVVFLPFFLLLAYATALGVSLWFAAWNVQFRDVRYVVPFLTQIWMFCTPVVYASSILSEKWKMLYALNPMVGVTEGFRWALLGTNTAPGPMIIASTGTALAILIGGAYQFRRLEKTFADIA